MESAMKKEAECKAIEAAMPDLLFDPQAAPEAARAHVASCANCRAELDALSGTMLLMDAWEASEPSPFWNARMGALLREEQAKPAHGWAGLRERVRTRLWLSNHKLKPMLAGAAALALVVAAGGGAWLDLATGSGTPASVQASNTVRDLQSLNENAQVFQQMSSLDGPDNGAQNAD